MAQRRSYTIQPKSVWTRRMPPDPQRGSTARRRFADFCSIHDGSARDLPAVVDHYDRLFRLDLTPRQEAELVEYLKSL